MGCLLAVAAPAYATNTSKAVIGTTPAQVHAKFPGVIHANLASYAGAARLARLSAVELQDLTLAYARNTGGNTTDLVNIAAVYAPTQLPRMRLAATNALNGWAGTNTYYRSRMKLTYGPAPTLDMTIQEIYLEFRTAPVGALSAEAAVYSTASFVMINLAAAYGIGYTIGSGVHWLIETYAPEWDNKIGSLMDTLLTDLSIAGSANEGYYEFYLDEDVFWVPLTDLQNGNDFGDFGLFDDMSSFWPDPYCIEYPYC